MAANVIAFSVRTGSRGYSIARQVADQLAFRYYDWEITTAAAQRAGVTPNDVIAAERVPGFVERMMMRLGAVSSASVEGVGVFTEPSPTAWNAAMLSLNSDDYRQVIEKVILELADQGGAVIVGHAAQFTLRDRSDTLKVLVGGSLSARVAQYAEEQGISAKEAELQVKQSDKDRTELLRRVYHFDWLNAEQYDICLNTDSLSDEYCVEAIVKAVERLP